MAKKVPIVQATFYNNNTKQIENCYPMTSAKGVVMSDGKTLEESFSDKADDSTVVHKSGDEEILGRKTFDDLRANGIRLSDDGDWNRWVSAFYSFLENKGVIQFGTEEDWSVILRNLADPEYENDAATKGYVDSKIAGAASIPVLQYGALINNNIPSVFEREEQAIANAPIYAKILSGEVQFFAAKIGGVGLFVSRSISSNKSSFELIGLDFKNLAEILITINIDQSGLTQAVTLSKNLQSVLTDTDGGYGQRVAELETGKANLQHQHTVADITNFPELYYDATAFFASGAYPSDKYEELLEAVKAKKTVYATIDEEGYVSHVFFMSTANSDDSSSRVLLTTIFADGSNLYTNTFVLQQSGMTSLQENITGKANKAKTLAGYGIADAYTKREVDALLNGKQDTLTAGNGISIEGGVISASVAEVVDKIVNAGYVFAGVATPSTDPGTPEAKVFYIANGKGTYTNFGGLEVTEDEVVVLYYDTEWHKVATGIASQDKLTELESETGKQLINVIPVQNNQYLIKEGFLIATNTNKWVAQNAKYIIYPLTESGTIEVKIKSGVSSVIATLSEYSEPYPGMPGNLVQSVTSKPVNYGPTEKYLYILLFYNSDRLPISISVNGYDIMKDVKENLDSGFLDITTERIPDGSITPEKLSPNFNEVRIGILYYGSSSVLNFDFTNKTCTIPTGSRIFLNSRFAYISNQDNVLDLTHDYEGAEIAAYGGGVIIFDTTTSKCKIIKHTNSIYNRNFVVIATYNIAAQKVNCPSTYIQDGRFLNIKNHSCIGILYSSSKNKDILKFDFTNKVCTIASHARIFINSKVIIANVNEVTLDISKDYNGLTLSYGGCIVWDTSDNTYKVLSHTNDTFVETQIVLATFNVVQKSVSSPSTYSIDGRMYGLDIPDRQQDITKKISPDFELIQLPNGVSWWSDFIIINIDGIDEMWIFTASSDENHQSNNGAIYRIKMSDWTLIATIKHNFGHCNTVHYDKYHDNLLIANLPGTTQLPSALYVFYNISSWTDNSSLDFNSLSPSIIDVSSVIPNNLAAFWAENGFDNRNQVYLISAYGTSPKFAKIVLGMGANQLTNGTYDNNHTNDEEFNGTFDILIQPITYNNPADNDENKNVIQGGDFVNGQVITANGHDQIYGFIWSYNPKESLIERVEIDSVPRKANGEIDYSTGEGLCVHNGYIYHGYIKTSADFRTDYTVQGYYLAKYRIP